MLSGVTGRQPLSHFLHYIEYRRQCNEQNNAPVKRMLREILYKHAHTRISILEMYLILCSYVGCAHR